MTFKFELDRDFVQCTQVSSSFVYSLRSYRVDKQTNTKNKQTLLKTSTGSSLRYAMMLGKNCSNTNYELYVSVDDFVGSFSG